MLGSRNAYARYVIDHRAQQQFQQHVRNVFHQRFVNVCLHILTWIQVNYCINRHRLKNNGWYKKDIRLQKWIALPADFVANYATLTAKATHVGNRQENADYKLFQPYLDQLLEYNVKKAGFYDKNKPIYDVLLNEYEPGLTQDKTQCLFDELKTACLPLLKAVQSSRCDFKPIQGPFNEQSQWDYSLHLLTLMGFDFSKGKQDKSTHPFTIDIHPNDVRQQPELKS